MGDVTHFPRPIRWDRLRSDEAERIVRQRSQEGATGQVIFTDHTWDRVSEREITQRDVYRILRTGHCHKAPIKNEKGDWQATMVKKIAGNRDAGVVTVILEDKELLIIRTVQWMDMR